MNDDINKIIEQLTLFVHEHIPKSFTGKVVATGDAISKGIIRVSFNGLTYKVRLKSIIDEGDKGIFIVPTQDSKVLCIPEHLSDTRYVMAACNTWSKIVIKGANTSLILDDDANTINFNQGGYDGLIKINDLVTRMNNIENDINTLKGVISAWVPVPLSGGMPLKAAAQTWAASPLTTTNKQMIENDKIKHG